MYASRTVIQWVLYNLWRQLWMCLQCLRFLLPVLFLSSSFFPLFPPHTLSLPRPILRVCLFLPFAVLIQLSRCWLVLLCCLFCFALLLFCLPGLGSVCFLPPSLPPFPFLSFVLPACWVLPPACSLPLLFFHCFLLLVVAGCSCSLPPSFLPACACACACACARARVCVSVCVFPVITNRQLQVNC